MCYICNVNFQSSNFVASFKWHNADYCVENVGTVL